MVPRMFPVPSLPRRLLYGMVLDSQLIGIFRKVLIECDSHNVVNLWDTQQDNRAEISSILAEIKELSRSFVEYLLYS